ncbi:Mutual gliding-motility protein MglA [Rubrivivax sp. A210]|uniref:GTP-binding protein n=1 Tax=Rubrivivax sp. A210 TaxID=2772301 RepID=UPI00191A011C|nr:GTPase domain-containing protein [Rubrivivax sp. A210]CAD5374363.1 Mutual gliding-motility protein MglA [Rubrivivax sp. A210]
MPELDEAAARLTFKLVYYGPAQSGKTSNLTWLHELLRAEMKGELMTLETQSDRTLFFDLLPLGFRAPSGLLVKLRLFTVPGQVQHDGTRKAVLSRADGVVFVADSQRHEAANNAEAFQNLADNAARVGLDFEHLPLVVQFNKRDLPEVAPEAEIQARYAATPWPVCFASALRGEGVVPTFARLLAEVWRHHDEACGLSARHGLDEAGFVRAFTGDAV